jgi:hypothetical protein
VLEISANFPAKWGNTWMLAKNILESP